MSRKLSLFLSHSQTDRDLYEELETRLGALQQDGVVLQEQLEQADLILLLVSPDYLTSPDCNLEVSVALELTARGKAILVPVILRPANWEESAFHSFKALPTGGRPITQWRSRDEAYVDILRGIRQLSEERWTSSAGPLPSPSASSNGASGGTSKAGKTPKEMKQWVKLATAVVVMVTAFVTLKIALKDQQKTDLPKVEPPPKHGDPPKPPISLPKPPAPRFPVAVELYNGADTPRFSVDGKPLEPQSYVSGVGEFRLPAGPHHLVADYPGQTCDASFAVPAQGKVMGNCNPK